MGTRVEMAKPEHEAAYQDLCAIVNKYADKLSPIELLAIAANMTGKLAAMQDQRSISPDYAMEVISRNLEYGNKTVIDQLRNAKGGSA